MAVKNAAGMSIQGGRRENFYFCLLEYYQEQKRWFLKSLLPVKEEFGKNADQAITDWIAEFGLGILLVDFPLTLPPVLNEDLDDEKRLNSISVVESKINELLEADNDIYDRDPKQYEYMRVEAEKVHYSRSPLAKKTSDPILSRAFKRKLKKGFLPYWNRPIDLWIWSEFYDPMLELFNQSYDSFGNVSTMLLFRMNYLKKFFPESLQLKEGNSLICLIELLRQDIITVPMIKDLYDIELASEARHDIIRQVEKHLDIFIYAHDIELMRTDSRAFQSFIMSLVGQRVLLKKEKEIPPWARRDQCEFVIPNFSS